MYLGDNTTHEIVGQHDMSINRMTAQLKKY
jgi:hypothetical protein